MDGSLTVSGLVTPLPPNLAATVAMEQPNFLLPPFLEISELDVVLGLTSVLRSSNANADPIDNIHSRTALMLYNSLFPMLEYNHYYYQIMLFFILNFANAYSDVFLQDLYSANPL